MDIKGGNGKWAAGKFQGKRAVQKIQIALIF
jgi:hypothetical protein